jgi:hypothetical protein
LPMLASVPHRAGTQPERATMWTVFADSRQAIHIGYPGQAARDKRADFARLIAATQRLSTSHYRSPQWPEVHRGPDPAAARRVVQGGAPGRRQGQGSPDLRRQPKLRFLHVS